MVTKSKQMAPRTKAYSYLRFSTPEQQRGDSFRRQTEAAREFARENGLDLDEQLTFEDLGVSAYRGRNAEDGRLADFLEAVRAGDVPKGSYLLVESLDRISRATARRAVRTLEDIVDKGVKVVTLMDGKVYDEDALDDPMGLIMSVLFFARANEESVTKGKRIRAAWNNKRKQLAQGHILTPRGPGWLRYDEEAGKFAPIPERVRVVKRIFKLAAEGHGTHVIATTLNGERVPVFGKAQYWHKSYVKKILGNTSVLGTLVPHLVEHKAGRRQRIAQDPVENYYPTIISRELFDAAAALRAGYATAARGRHATVPNNNIFSGLARCPHCQGSMPLKNKGKDKPRQDGTRTDTQRRYLVCSNQDVQAGCKGARAIYDHVEGAFLANASYLLSKCPSDDKTALELERKAKKIQVEIEGVQDEIAGLTKAAAGGRLGTARSINDKIVEAEDLLRTMRAERDKLEERAAAMTSKVLKQRIAAVLEVLEAEELDRQALNRTLRGVVEAVEVDVPAGRLHVRWRQGGRPASVAFQMNRA